MKRVRPGASADACRRDMTKDLIGVIARIEEQMKKYQDRISYGLAASGTTLMQIQGISTVLAAQILGETAGVSGFPTAAHFASYAGASPLDASNGENQRQRHNTGGSRQRNAVLHIMAVCQIQHGRRGRDY